MLSSKFLETEQERIPDYFWPKSGKWGIRGMSISHLLEPIALINMVDLHKTFIDDEHYNSGHGHAYEEYGVDSNVGAAIIVRPDQCKQSTRDYAATRKILMRCRCIESDDLGRLRWYRGVLCRLFDRASTHMERRRKCEAVKDTMAAGNLRRCRSWS